MNSLCTAWDGTACSLECLGKNEKEAIERWDLVKVSFQE